MNKFQGTRARRTTAALVTVTALAASLMTTTAAMATSAFESRMNSVIAHVKAEPGYKAIPMNTPADREWFLEESEQLFKKKISKEQYVADGSKQFPGYESSLTELADLITAS